MPRIFISYRRADSQYIADRIYDYMSMHFNEESVFQDVGDIPFGVDFRSYIQQEIDKCDTVLVIIGSDWVRIIQERIGHPTDFVRIEVETALEKNKLVIPVLVDGANMPSPSDLPESIQQLCYNNAAKVRPNPDFKRDCELLAANIKKMLELHSNVLEAVPQFDAPDLSDILPEPFEWCFIPAGKVTLTEGGYVPEGGQTFDVPSFYMAKYPITNAQYARFIEADGYNTRSYWTDAGWKLKEQEGWTKQGVDKWLWGNHPAIGISWYEAVAFCNWLNATVGAHGHAPKFALPTEQQWQRAAQGNDNRLYPWGNEFNKTVCNTLDSGYPTTTSVDHHPHGASPFGVFDMTGNVWEWCMSGWTNGANKAETIKDSVSIRGGSWQRSHTLGQTTDRSWDALSVRDESTGFRLSFTTQTP